MAKYRVVSKDGHYLRGGIKEHCWAVSLPAGEYNPVEAFEKLKDVRSLSTWHDFRLEKADD